jgi:hypothetical protein
MNSFEVLAGEVFILPNMPIITLGSIYKFLMKERYFC